METANGNGEAEKAFIYSPSSSYTKTFISKQDAWVALRYFIRRGMTDEACRIALDLLASSKIEEERLLHTLGAIMCEDAGYILAQEILVLLTHYQKRLIHHHAFKDVTERHRCLISIVFYVTSKLAKPTGINIVASDAARAIVDMVHTAGDDDDDEEDENEKETVSDAVDIVLKMATLGDESATEGYLNGTIREAITSFAKRLFRVLQHNGGGGDDDGPVPIELERALLIDANQCLLLAMAYGTNRMGNMDRAERKKRSMGGRQYIMDDGHPPGMIPYYFVGFEDWYKAMHPSLTNSKRLAGSILPGVRSIMFMLIQYMVFWLSLGRGDNRVNKIKDYPFGSLWLHGGAWLDDAINIEKSYGLHHTRSHLFLALMVCTRAPGPNDMMVPSRDAILKTLEDVDNVLQRDPNTRPWYIPLVGESKAFLFDWKNKEELAIVRESLPRLTDHMHIFTVETAYGQNAGQYDAERNLRNLFKVNELDAKHIEDVAGTHPSKFVASAKAGAFGGATKSPFNTEEFFWQSFRPNPTEALDEHYSHKAKEAFLAEGGLNPLEYCGRAVKELRETLNIEMEPVAVKKRPAKTPIAANGCDDEDESDKKTNKKKKKGKKRPAEEDEAKSLSDSDSSESSPNHRDDDEGKKKKKDKKKKKKVASAPLKKKPKTSGSDSE